MSVFPNGFWYPFYVVRPIGYITLLFDLPPLSKGFIPCCSCENQKFARCVLTDSGTVQEESCILGVPTVTIRNSSERPETIVCGSNLLAGLSQKRIVECTQVALKSQPFWAIPEGYNDLNVSDKVIQFICEGIQ